MDDLTSPNVFTIYHDYYNYQGLQTLDTSYTPKTVPLDLTTLAFEPQSDEQQSPGRIPTGSTVPDPVSVYEGGRSWQAYKEDSYFLPNDGDEQDRLDLQHHLWLLMMSDKLYWAPLRNEPRNVLDIGTGTGIWAIEFAEQHPTSTVIGTDLSQIQPSHAAPPNCTFVREDVEDDWTLERLFDFIHLRLMVTCFKSHRDVLKKAYDNLALGGYLEWHEIEFQCYPVDESLEGTNFQKWVKLMRAAGAALGRDFSVALRYKDWMDEIGYVDVVETPFASAGGPWPAKRREREVGKILNMDTSSFVEGSMMLLRKGLNMSLDETDAFTPLVVKDLANPKIKWYMMNRVVYGRKPFPEEICKRPENFAPPQAGQA